MAWNYVFGRWEESQVNAPTWAQNAAVRGKFCSIAYSLSQSLLLTSLIASFVLLSCTIVFRPSSFAKWLKVCVKSEFCYWCGYGECGYTDSFLKSSICAMLSTSETHAISVIQQLYSEERRDCTAQLESEFGKLCVGGRHKNTHEKGCRVCMKLF